MNKQSEITTEYFNNLQGMLRRRIRRCEEEATSTFENKHRISIEDIDDNSDLIKDLGKHLFWNESKVIKSALNAHKQMINFIEKNYSREIRYSKEDKYVLDKEPVWMMNDEKIVQMLKRFQYTIPILNYLWNYNRFTRGEKLKEMFSLTKKVTDGLKHKTDGRKKWEYATFITNKEFYKKMSEKTGCSKIYLQKYLVALTKAGIIKRLGNVGIYGTLYADGYYVGYGDYRKEALLHKSTEFKKVLRSFNPF